MVIIHFYGMVLHIAPVHCCEIRKCKTPVTLSRVRSQTEKINEMFISPIWHGPTGGTIVIPRGVNHNKGKSEEQRQIAHETENVIVCFAICFGSRVQMFNADDILNSVNAP